MKKILFVCTGNTCRSVMAEAFFNNIITDMQALGSKYVSFSAGICAAEGSPPSENTLRVMRTVYGIDAGLHKARRITEKDICESSLVLAMTSGHKQHLQHIFPSAADKIFTLAEYAGIKDYKKPSAEGNPGDDLKDPYGMPFEVYLKSAAEIRGFVEKVASRLATVHNK